MESRAAGKKLKCKCGATFDAPELTAPLPTLDYRHPDVSPRSRADRISVEDSWEGNKAKNLFLPIILIVASVIVSYLSEQYAGNATPIEPEHVWMDMGLNLATQIPAMLLACWVAMHWLDTTFGPVGPAILKLCSICSRPMQLWGITTLAGMLWGHSSGSGGMIIGSLLVQSSDGGWGCALFRPVRLLLFAGILRRDEADVFDMGFQGFWLGYTDRNH